MNSNNTRNCPMLVSRSFLQSFKIYSRERVLESFTTLISHSAIQHQPLLLESNEMSTPYRSHGRVRDPSRVQYYFSNMFMNLTVFIIFLSFVYVVISLEDEANNLKNAKNLSRNLLLTPLIDSGNIQKARKLAKVKGLFQGIKSFSGYLTVDQECKSHLFFWFIPATSGNESAPLILWHGGGPGTSGLFGLFQGTGPVTLDKHGQTVVENKFSLTTDRSVLYLDSPVGTGFSYSEAGSVCYANSSDDVAVSVVTALRQFYLLFPEYERNHLYMASSSYGGKFLPVIAWIIENENQLDEHNEKSNLTSINLKGFISISGFSDPLNQIDYGDYYYNVGLIDGIQLRYFLAQESLGKSLVRNKKYFEAYQVVDPLILGKDGHPSYLQNVTGINYPYNFVKDLTERKSAHWMFRHNNFLNLKRVREAIHVDLDREFKSTSDAVYNNLLSDLYVSVGGKVEELLSLRKYKFLFTSGQFDLIVPHTTISKFLHELKWHSGYNFKEKGNSLWTCKGKVIGHGKSLDNLTYIMFRNAGHHPFIDQPECTIDIILNFTE